MYVDHRFNLLNGTRDRYEIRHTGRLGKYKTKLVNTFFDLVTPGHRSLLLHYCTTVHVLSLLWYLDIYYMKILNWSQLVTPGHTWSQSGFFTKLFWGGVPQELQKSARRAPFALLGSRVLHCDSFDDTERHQVPD